MNIKIKITEGEVSVNCKQHGNVRGYHPPIIRKSFKTLVVRKQINPIWREVRCRQVCVWCLWYMLNEWVNEWTKDIPKPKLFRSFECMLRLICPNKYAIGIKYQLQFHCCKWAGWDMSEDLYLTIGKSFTSYHTQSELLQKVMGHCLTPPLHNRHWPDNLNPGHSWGKVSWTWGLTTPTPSAGIRGRHAGPSYRA